MRTSSLLLVAFVVACAGGERGVTLHPDGAPEKLSQWHLLEVRDGALVPSAGVVPYDLNTPLFSDYAHKLRTVWMPAEASADYDPARPDSEGDLGFPPGTVFTKTFYYPRPVHADDGGGVRRVGRPRLELEAGALPLDRNLLLETRLLVHGEGGWEALPYVWNEEQSEAYLEVTGTERQLALVAEGGEAEPFLYIVPDKNQCAGCHATNHSDRKLRPIGPKVRHLNRDLEYAEGRENQLVHWARVGYLPPLDPDAAPASADAGDPASGSLEERARAYLDVNCGHCHNPEGPADTSGLFLNRSVRDQRRLGVCKPPIAAGRGSGDRLVSIHPGRPEDSIMVFRMDSTDPGIAMPELGRSTVHREGVELIADWVRSLDGDCRLVLAGG